MIPPIFCCICKKELDISVDEFIENDADIDEYFCDECAKIAYDFCMNMILN